jgi:hypothetical protein
VPCPIGALEKSRMFDFRSSAWMDNFASKSSLNYNAQL